MDLLMLELLLWAVLLFCLWAMKDGLASDGSELEAFSLSPTRNRGLHRDRWTYDRAETVKDPIGTYQEQCIYRFAVIGGRTYQFDRVCPPDSAMTIDSDERYLAPGLVYQECREERSVAGC